MRSIFFFFALADSLTRSPWPLVCVCRGTQQHHQRPTTRFATGAIVLARAFRRRSLSSLALRGEMRCGFQTRPTAAPRNHATLILLWYGMLELREKLVVC